jgi:hypothetical protein
LSPIQAWQEQLPRQAVATLPSSRDDGKGETSAWQEPYHSPVQSNYRCSPPHHALMRREVKGGRWNRHTAACTGSRRVTPCACTCMMPGKSSITSRAEAHCKWVTTGKRSFVVVPQGVAHDQVDETELASICIGSCSDALINLQGCWVDADGMLEPLCRQLLLESTRREPFFEQITFGLMYVRVSIAQRKPGFVRPDTPNDRWGM